MYKFVMDVIIGDKRMTNFMRAADVFESWKVLGEHHSVEVTVEDSCNIFTLTKAIAEHIEKGNIIVTFIGLKTIDGLPVVNGNHYVSEGVKVISNGRKWGLAKKIISDLGYEVVTDEFNSVIKVLSI